MLKKALLALLMTFSAISFADPVSYPLECRGSNQSNLTFGMMGNALSLSFVKSTKPASMGLNPGECSWLDRGLHPDEPNLMFQASNGATVSPSIQFNGTGKITQILTNPVSGSMEIWFKELMIPTNYWVFEIYNSGKGYYWVTKAYRKQ